MHLSNPVPEHPAAGTSSAGTLPSRAALTDPITAHLRQDFARLHLGQTVADALQELRARPPQGRVIYLYVVDADDVLRGIVPTRRLLLSTPETPLADIMVRRVITLPAAATVLDACEFFVQHRLLGFPVVDEAGRILGVVDVELYTDEVHNIGDSRERDDVFQLVGVHLTQGQRPSVWAAFRARFPWLGCNLAAGILAAFLSGVYETELKAAVALAFFIPVVLNLAESVSSQSVSISLQVMHGRPPTLASLWRDVRREVVTGLFLGVGAAIVVAVTALVWLGERRVALCLVGGITGGMAAAAGLGLALPVVLRMLHLEPRVAAGPIALAAADVITILIYFNLARWLLS
jgi:magnesium transporter